MAGWRRRTSGRLAVAVMALALIAADVAGAKPIPTTLTIKAVTVLSEFTPEQIAAGYPTTGKGLAGRASSPTPACERNRPLVLHYQHRFSDGPVTQPFYADSGRVTTGKDGTWSTGPLNLLYYWNEPNVVRVSVSTPARGRCAAAESPTIKVPAIVVKAPTGVSREAARCMAGGSRPSCVRRISYPYPCAWLRAARSTIPGGGPYATDLATRYGLRRSSKSAISQVSLSFGGRWRLESDEGAARFTRFAIT